MEDPGTIETLSAMLCLLTRAVWEPELPAPLTRPMVRRMLESGELSGLVLREGGQTQERVLTRSRALLTRAKRVCELVQHYEQAGYTALTPRNAGWPRALRALGKHMPLFLFARGNLTLTGGTCVAVAGSRQIAPATKEMAARLGRELAREGYVLVTGGARGVDTASLAGALEAGGSAILVPAKPAERMLDSMAARRALEEGRLLILCDTLPDEPFSAAKALSRNHTLYALGGAAVVAASREGIGGSWHGATDCLRGGWTPVYAVSDAGEDGAGNRALLALGAAPLEMDRPLGAQLFALRQTSLLETGLPEMSSLNEEPAPWPDETKGDAR